MTSGAGGGSLQSSAVPEPANWLLAALAATVVGARNAARRVEKPAL
jgi:hypothetical protein